MSPALAWRDVQMASGDVEAAPPSLHIGVSSSLSLGFLRALIRDVRARPDAPALVLVDGSPHEVLQAARYREIDVGFVHGPYSLTRLQFEELWREPLVVVLPDHHPLAMDCEVRPDQLARETFLALGRHSDRGPQYALVESVIGGPPAGFHCLEVERETLINLVGLGFGVTLAPGSSLGAFYPGVTYRPIAAPFASTPFCAVWRTSNRRPELRAFLGAARALAAAWGD